MHSEQAQYVTGSWAECIGLTGRELISLVGAGGKSSLMNALARELALAGQRVIKTTTTRIVEDGGRLILESEPDKLRAALSGAVLPGEAVTVAAGRERAKGYDKLIGLAPETVDAIFESGAAEYLLVEADGSRRLAIKAPRSGEPVLASQTTVLIGLIGLSAIGRPLTEENCLAAERLADLAGVEPGSEITPRVAAALAAHSQGLFKAAPAEAWPVLFLNQADLPGAREAGLDIIRALAPLKSGLRVVLGSISQGFREVYELSGD